MNTIVIQPKSKSNFDLILALMKKMGEKQRSSPIRSSQKLYLRQKLNLLSLTDYLIKQKKKFF